MRFFFIGIWRGRNEEKYMNTIKDSKNLNPYMNQSTAPQSHKICNCIGPDQCRDLSCKLVQEKQVRNNGNKPLNKGF
jgi:hypothetical protein